MTTTNHTFSLPRIPHGRFLDPVLSTLRSMKWVLSEHERTDSPSEHVLRDLPPVHTLQR